MIPKDVLHCKMCVAAVPHQPWCGADKSALAAINRALRIARIILLNRIIGSTLVCPQLFHVPITYLYTALILFSGNFPFTPTQTRVPATYTPVKLLLRTTQPIGAEKCDQGSPSPEYSSPRRQS